jgi:hypothetical protein
VNRKREKPSFKKKRSVRELLRSVGLVAHKHEGLPVCMSERTGDAELRFLVPSIIHPSWERHLLP